MASRLAEDLVCPICLGLFQEPHMLSCGHNFCLACLKSCVPEEGPREGTCPECRQPFVLGGLASNRALGSLARKAGRLKLDQEPLLLDHFCEDHEEPLKLFCKQDRLPICVICRDLPEHRGHDILPTKNAVDYAQKKLKPYLKSLKKKKENIVYIESSQLKEIDFLEIHTTQTLSYIAKQFEAVHRILHEKEDDIKKQFQEMKEENLEEMQGALTSLKNDISLHTELIAGIEKALTTTTGVSFLKDFKDLVGKNMLHPPKCTWSSISPPKHEMCVIRAGKITSRCEPQVLLCGAVLYREIRRVYSGPRGAYNNEEPYTAQKIEDISLEEMQVNKVKECQLKSVEDDSSNMTDEEEDTSDEESVSSHKAPRDNNDKKSAQARPRGSKGPVVILEEEEDDSEDEVQEEEEEEDEVQEEEEDDDEDDIQEEEEGEKVDYDRVVFVQVEIEEFRTFLDFKAWAKMLESIKPNLG